MADWLSGVITSAIDRGSVLVNESADTAVANVMTEIGKALPPLAATLLDPALQDAQAQLLALAKTAVSEASSGLDSAINTALAASAANFAAALKKLGATIGPVFQSLDDALTPVRQVLTKVDAQFHQLIVPVQQALQQKVTAKLTFEDSISTETTVVVDGAFTQSNAQTAAIYGAPSTTGRATAGDQHFRRQLAAVGFTLDAGNSSITRFSKQQSGQGLEVSLLGLDLNWSLVWSGSAKVFTDGLGNTHVDAAANLDQSFASTLTSRRVSFVQTAAIVGAAARAQAASKRAAPVLEIGVSATYASKRLIWNNVDAVVKQLRGQQLVTAGCEDHAQARFAGWAGASAGSINGSVGASLRFAGTAIATLLQLDHRVAPDNALDAGAQQSIAHAALGYVRQRNPSGTGDFDRGMRSYLNACGSPSLGDEAAVLDAIQYLPGDMPSMENLPTLTIVSDSGGLADYVQFFEDVFLVQQVIDIIDWIGRVYLAEPGAWSAQQYANAEDRIATDSHNWVNLWSPAIDLFGPQVSPWTVTFMRNPRRSRRGDRPSWSDGDL